MAYNLHLKQLMDDSALPVTKVLAQKLGLLETARAIKRKLFDTLLKGQQVIGIEAAEYKVPFDGREIGFPICGTHSKQWFQRYRDITQNGWHEPSLTRLLEMLAKDSKCLIDIGAHLGYFSALFASAPDRTAYSVELNPKTFSLLERTLTSASGVKGKTMAVNAGFSDEEGEVLVTSAFTSPTFSLAKTEENPDARGRRVNITTLDWFCADAEVVPDFIKIDVEGFEQHVWRGGQQVISKYRPFVLMELHTPQLKAQSISTLAFIHEIQTAGYLVFSTQDNRSKQAEPFLPLDELPQAQNFDILCVPKDSDFLAYLGNQVA